MAIYGQKKKPDVAAWLVSLGESKSRVSLSTFPLTISELSNDKSGKAKAGLVFRPSRLRYSQSCGMPMYFLVPSALTLARYSRRLSRSISQT